ncbi:hypothetical protein K8I61_18870, partial [bacterium]|nr:hypothetical protein [bacterium]
CCAAFARALGGGGPNAAQQALAAALAQGRAYVDVSRRRFARLGAQLRSMEEVEPGELREYNEWRRSRGLRPVRAPEPEGFSP